MPLIRPEYHPLDQVPACGVLAAISFGGDARSESLTINVPVPQIGPPLAEVWRTEGSVRRESHDGVMIACTQHVLFGTIRTAGRSDRAAADAYEAIIAACRAAGYTNLWRIWNHVGGINEMEEGLERYKRFSAGRHEALTRHGYARERFPAASAVGMSEPGLLVYFLAGKEAGVQVENPRQVSAYDYPPQYGPCSPSFSRATVVAGELIFVSGTASVVGHETLHTDSAVAQLEETIENLDVTLASAAARIGRPGPPPELTVAKIYIRAGVDHRPLEARLRDVFPAAILLQSNICRRELLLEIEGVAVLG